MIKKITIGVVYSDGEEAHHQQVFRGGIGGAELDPYFLMAAKFFKNLEGVRNDPAPAKNRRPE